MTVVAATHIREPKGLPKIRHLLGRLQAFADFHSNLRAAVMSRLGVARLLRSGAPVPMQGYTNVGDFAGTFAFGIRNRIELFDSLLFNTRIDCDVRPLFVDDSNFSGVIDRYPRVNRGWMGDNLGDLYLCAKINFWSEARQNPAAFACAR